MKPNLAAQIELSRMEWELERDISRRKVVDQIIEKRRREPALGYGRYVGTDEWLGLMYERSYDHALTACADAVLYWRWPMEAVWIDRYGLTKNAVEGNLEPFKADMEKQSDLFDGSIHSAAGVWPWPDEEGCWWRKL